MRRCALAVAVVARTASANVDLELHMDVPRAPEQQASVLATETFTMAVEADGTAHLRDKRNLQLALRMPSKADIGDALRVWYDRPKGGEGYTQPQLEERPLENPIRSIGMTILRFDITDWMMRWRGQDPYASEKLKLLDATRDQRVAVGTVYREQQLRHASEQMEANVDRAWESTPDPAARKRAVFELWDECVETGTELEVAAGSAARARLVELIHARIPASSHDPFTPVELEAFAARRRSRAVFTPYDRAGEKAGSRSR